METYLLIYFIIMLFLSYHIIDNNILYPTNLYFIGCIISCIALIYGNNIWKVEFSEKTVLIYILGSSVFFLTSLIYRYCSKGYNTMLGINIEPKEILLNKNIIYICVIFQCVILLIYCIFLFKNVSGNTISFLLHAYRKGRKSGDIILPFLLGQCIKLTWALASIEAYIFIHNIVVVSKNKLKGNVIYLVGIFVFICLQILQSSRVYILLIAIEMLFLYFLFRQKVRGNKRVVSLVSSIKICLIGIVTIYLFVYFGQLIGRTSADTLNPLHYVASYAGSTMQIFNIYVKESVVNISAWGNGTLYTFDGFDKLFNYFGMVTDVLPQTKQYVSVNGVVLGNICANYFYWLYDFGLIGVVGLSMIMSLVYSIFFRKVMKEVEVGKIKLSVLYYSCIVYALVMNGISDYFYRSILSINYISMFILCAIVVKFIFKIRIKFK